jgi:hypothetical protein
MSDKRFKELDDKYGWLAPGVRKTKFVGRQATKEEEKIFKELGKIFAPAQEAPFRVWQDWTDYQIEVELRERENEN